nr:MAG TPA: hypothetical protein [Caudoviricetes sp.]
MHRRNGACNVRKNGLTHRIIWRRDTFRTVRGALRMVRVDTENRNTKNIQEG